MKKVFIFILALVASCSLLISCGLVPDEENDGMVSSGDNNGTENGGASGGENNGSYTPHVHSYSKTVKNPTCTEQGYTTYTCTCGDSYNDDYSDTIAHDYTSSVISPTCTEQGYTVYSCANCSTTYKDDYTAAGNHDYRETSKAPTCTDKGYTTYTCINCNNTYTDNEVPAVGHTPGDEATCTSAQICTVCEKVLVYVLQHTLGDWETIQDASCMQAGEKQRVCENCPYSESETIPLTKHEFVDKICVSCGTPYFSEGLEYKLIDDTYSVVGIGTCTDIHVIIPNVYNGIPVTTIGESAFAKCASINSVYLPDNVTSIGTYAFNSCSKLTFIEFSDNFNGIGVRAFENCTGLEHIKLPDSLKSIGGGAFRGCTALAYITIPDGIETIGQAAFYGCTSLHTITLPFTGESATATGNKKHFGYIFDYQTTGYDFSIPASLTMVTITKFIPESAFLNCKTIKSVTISDGILTIPIGAFYGCTKLSSISIPDSVTCIDEQAFYGCKAITFINLPDSITSIEGGAFYGCSALASIVIPENVTKIGSSAFEGCSALTSITIPKKVKFIGYRAFNECKNLTSVTFKNTNGWWYSSGPNSTAGTSISSTQLANATTAAKYLKTEFCNQYWHCD